MDYIVTKLDETKDGVPVDTYAFKTIETVKDINDKDVQVYREVGSYVKAEVEEKVARLTDELAKQQEILDAINNF